MPRWRRSSGRRLQPTFAGRRVESLFRALGATISERAGSRVAVAIEYQTGAAGEKAVAVRVFHRPHPRPEAPRATVQDVRDFLEQVGVTP